MAQTLSLKAGVVQIIDAKGGPGVVPRNPPKASLYACKETKNNMDTTRYCTEKEAPASGKTRSD